MPFGDGTGPAQGQGRGLGRGSGRNRTGKRMGPGGYCVCPSCGEKVVHKQGVACNQTTCPKCGTRMTREQKV